MDAKLQRFEIEAAVLGDHDFPVEHASGGQLRANGSSSSGKYRLSDFPSRLWIRTSSPSRNISARKPSHFGSKIQLAPEGNSAIRFESIGRIGGFTGSCTLSCYTAWAEPRERKPNYRKPRQCETGALYAFARGFAWHLR